MNIKRCFIIVLTVILLIPALCMTVAATEGEKAFRYELTVDGADTVEVVNGDIITVTLHLYRTDSQENYTMYAMQDEIRYDSSFFELVEDGLNLYDGVQSTDISVANNRRELYMNFLSFIGGEQWESKTRIGTFQLRVTGTSGVTTLTNEDFLVSLPDGSGSYPCEANELTVIFSSECLVEFETNGGTPIDPVTVIFGELLPCPENPTREGKLFVGWYKDIHLTEEWNFETDTVTGNMTLYAKWENAPMNVPESDPEGGTEDRIDPTVEEKPHCLICGGENVIFTWLPLCRQCLLLIIVLVLVILNIVRRNRTKDKVTEKATEETNEKKDKETVKKSEE